MNIRPAIIFALFLVCYCTTVHAQPAAAQAPTKIAIVDTDAFSDQKAGVKRLVSAYDQINAEFKPRMDELKGLRGRYDVLVKSIQDTQKIADQKSLAEKAEQAESLKNDIERKQQDGQKALEKRTKELTDPIFSDIGKALQAYAKQRGIDLVIDMAKLAGTIMVINGALDITTAFMNDYNSRNTTVPALVPVKP